MKYIRTENGNIYEYVEQRIYKGVGEYTSKFGLYRHNCNSEYEQIIAEADTIEELCDEFCYIKDDIVRQYLTIDFKFKRDDEFCTLKNKLTVNGIAEISKGISKYELQVGELKCAIWTSKGLIYVAKLNEKGELELI